MKSLIISFFIIAQVLSAQNKVIQGYVYDENLIPLKNANVIVIGTAIGTATDSKGYFSLKGDFPQNAVLKISFLGFEPKLIPVKTVDFAHDLKVILKPAVLSSQTVLVQAAIGKEGETPIAFSKLSRGEISENYTIQDVPEYLSYLPSTTFYSENGNGIGYNYLSIRGFDQRRIAVSVNGIPQNDPEDHNIYWLDMPDLLSTTGLLQVQRGAGAGIMGYPAIGGSINIITSPFSDKRMFAISASVGSYNTRKYSLSLSSGLIDKKYSLYVKLSNILSSGYRDNSWVNFKAYYVSAVRYDKKLTTQINLYGGPIADGLAYTGLPKWTIKDKKLRRENYSYWEDDGKNYTWTTRRRPEEIENFFQPHFEILNEYKASENLKLNSALFLVLGNGFFDFDGSWADTSYLRLTSAYGFHPTTNPANVLIRAMVENVQWGWIPRVSWKHKKGLLTAGLELRKHRSVHWGSINFGEKLPAGLTKNYRYYYYEGGKDIFTAFVNENYKLSEKLSLLGEVQVAYHKYLIDNEKYVKTHFAISDVYFNPRFGLNYKLFSDLSSFISFARVTREPRLKNYYDAAESSGGAVPQFKVKADGSYDFSQPLVQPETMNDFEAGINYHKAKLDASVNLFYMLFDNEIVKKGQVDRFGQPITGNMKSTVHSGVEFSGKVALTKNISLVVNGSYSDNFIKDGETFVKYRDSKTGSKKVAKLDLKNNRIAGFPDITFNAILKVKFGHFSLSFSGKYVGGFYSDNYGDKLKEYLNKYPGFVSYSDNKVDAYFVSNLFFSYYTNRVPFFKTMKTFLQINNLFDNLYAAYAIGGEFFPAAERNFLVGVKLGL
jgi:iron complex outermembrane receptor protein